MEAESCLRNMVNNCQQCEKEAAIAPGWELFSTNSETGVGACCLRNTATMIGWPEEKGGPCAQLPNLRVYMGGYPMSIRSFVSYSLRDGVTLRADAHCLSHS